MMLFLHNIFRLLQILFVLYRRGALFLFKDSGIISNFFIYTISIFSISTRNLLKGKRLKIILQDLGPFFIKFGQTLATRADLIGESAALELSKLQDRLPTVKYKNIEKYIEKELDCSIDKKLRYFDKKPIATASIAVVFKAKTLEGNKVAIKLLKPNIEKEFQQDLKLFFSIARFTEKFFISLKRLRLVEIVKIFADTTKHEMDLRLEAAAASELKENHRYNKDIYIPKIYWELTSKRMLVMEWIDGIPIYDLDKLQKKNYNLSKIIKSFTFMFLNQAYKDGFFHADLHPGNIFIMKDGKIALIDFGIMGRLDKKTRIYLAEILRGFLTKDYNHVAKIHFKAGYVPNNKSINHFAQACRAIGEPIIGVSADKISVGKLLSHLFKVTRDFDMVTQPQLLLIQKTTVVVEGLCLKLDPTVNMWTIAEPWIKEWAEKNLKFDARIVDYIEEWIEFFNTDFKEFIRSNIKEKNGT